MGKGASIRLHILNIIFSLISIVLAAFVLINPEMAIWTIGILLSIALLVIGIDAIVGILSKSFLGGSRVSEVAVGILLLILGSLGLIYPRLAIGLLIPILAFGLLVLGAVRILTHGSAQGLPSWSRWLLVCLGLLAIALSGVVITFPTLGITYLVVILSAAFIFAGITNMVPYIIRSLKSAN